VRRTHRILAVFILLLAVLQGCKPATDAISSGDSGTASPPDSGQTDETRQADAITSGDQSVKPDSDTSLDVPSDTDVDVSTPELVPIGTPCNDNDDCGWGYCIEGPDGKVCTQTCTDECPSGWACELLDLGSDDAYVCVPQFFSLCTPCENDTDCGAEYDYCVPMSDEGNFCAMHCSADMDCPNGYACNSVWTITEIVAKQCVPITGSCGCKAGNQGEKQPCEISNQYGVCTGLKTCLGAAGWSACDTLTPVPEVCDGVDNDCNGDVDDGFPDVDEDGLADCVDPDADNDGLINEEDNCPDVANLDQLDTDQDTEGDACDLDDDDDNDPDVTDCDPLDPSAHAGAKELCDGIDNNCNKQVDEGFIDTDLDGLADCTDPDDDNDDDPDETDCNPLNFNVYNGAMEACDGLDNDCNGKIDEGFPDKDGDGVANCVDVDTDGDGDPDESDCAPFNANIHSFAPEVCDGIDNNCNKQVDEGYPDYDQDGLANCIDDDDDDDGDPDDTDCSPLNDIISSKSTEICDGYDNNCNGKVDEGFPNSDGDGEVDCIDNDDDNDGDPDVVDCAPTNPDINHDAKETCDGVDNDCNLLVDEVDAAGCILYYKDKDDDGWGMDNKFQCLCGPLDEYTAFKSGDCDDSTWTINPDGVEICNNLDDDCDAIKDNPGSLGCKEYFIDADQDGYGAGAPMCICWPDDLYTTLSDGDCNEGDPMIHPAMSEDCDNIDNNCDGQIDEGVNSTCGNCDPACSQVEIGPDGGEQFTLEDENSSGLSEDDDGFLQLDKEQVSLAFIWIANSGAGTVSKLDTISGQETGRYTVCSNPSRTSVDLYGDVWVACRGDGGVSKIHVYENNCIDKNNDGQIQTSRDINGNGTISGNEMYAKGADECVRFITFPGGSCQRAAGVDKENYAWIGEWYGKRLRRLHPDDGHKVQEIAIPSNPYGLVIDGKGIIWVSGRGGSNLVRVDPSNGQVNTYSSNLGCLQPYGITLDYKERVWIGNCCCWHVGYRFDPSNNQWAAAGVHARPRGIAGATNGRMYIANDQSSQVAVVDADSMQTLAYINLGSNRFPVGMAVDFDGFIWAVNQSSSSATKIDPNTNQIVLEHAVGSSPYTYSDMTGYSLHSYTQPQGYYQHVIPGAPTGTTIWTLLDVNVTINGASEVKVRLKAANTAGSLASTDWKGPYGPFPPNVFPMDLSAIPELTGKYLQVEIVMIPDEDGNTPLLKGFTVQYHNL
jgi:streptogramin lyase